MSADADDRPTRVAAAILAGGRGRRLGNIDKASLVLGERTILDRQVSVLTPLFTRILLVGNRHQPTPAGVVAVADRVPPGAGPLAGLEAALAALTPVEDAVVCVAADMPLLRPQVLRLLRDTAPLTTALVPHIAGHPEPLLARYPRAALPTVTTALSQNRLALMALLPHLDVTWLDEPTLRSHDPHLRSFTNVNDPADLERAIELLREPNDES